VWLAAVAKEGWIIFSHDRKFHVQLAEIAAIKQYSGGCFYLPGASSPLWDKVHYFMRGYVGIRSRIENTNKPFIFNLGYNGKFSPVRIPG
jgi:hypothetical protein